MYLRYVKFTEVLAFPVDEAGAKFGNIGEFTFSCNYKAFVSTNVKQFDVRMHTLGSEIEEFVTWDSTMDFKAVIKIHVKFKCINIWK